MLVVGFDWDGGNREKCRKHGVSIVEIEDLFGGELITFPDAPHSRGEERIKAIGTTGQGRHVLVVFTMRRRGGERLIRPISARYMHEPEVAYYEKAIASAEER